jgi:DNA repair protein RadA/Sms
MARGNSTVYACTECGYQSPKWLGRCPDCGGWNTLVVGTAAPPPPSPIGPGEGEEPIPLPEIEADDQPRLPSGLADFDRALGGGIVPGSAVLLGGEPGIGKSTLLLQVAEKIATAGGAVLYVSGEESARQLRLRADRIGAKSPNLLVLVETSVERILAAAVKVAPAAIVVDSIQTMACQALPTGPGSLGQVRESANRLISFAKRSRTPLFLVGHVTKDGAIAGPKTLEHAVDTVLYFEGERFHRHRIVRAHKNRFGPVHEIGIFEMGEEGLSEVPNPSALLLSQRSAGAPGSTVFASIEGTRPLLVELQALVSTSRLASPRRLALGLDSNRVAVLLAVLERRAGVSLVDHDVYVNVAGGIEIEEPGADLAVAWAILSSHRNRPPLDGYAVFGEVGLLGEVRAVGDAERRLQEAAALGFKGVVFPAGNAAELARYEGIERLPVRKVEELADLLG